MAENSHPRLRLALGLAVALALAPIAVLHGCGSEDTPDAREAPAERRVAAGCEPSVESSKYEGLVGSRALAVLSWTGISEDAANLKIPIYVVGIESRAIGVRFLEFPMREQYLHIWLGSGHIRAAPENVFLLDPCSATLEPWPA
jgi:hypothetical protein